MKVLYITQHVIYGRIEETPEISVASYSDESGQQCLYHDVLKYKAMQQSFVCFIKKNKYQ